MIPPRRPTEGPEKLARYLAAWGDWQDPRS